MAYRVDRTTQLEEAVKHGRFGQVASLRAAGTPTRQHNVKKTRKAAAKKTAAKKTAAKKAAK